MKLLAIGALAAALALPLCACGTTGGNTVADAELAYTPLAESAAAYMNSGGADAATKATIKQLNDVIDTKGPDGQRTGLLVAARAAAQSGDDVTAAAEGEALRQAIAALGDFETKKGIKSP